ncbi:MAG TPA: DUF4337 domain-containing protein [Pseudomonadales bacterium]|nr:DUF4337 domain-containing protein [Pseudomonadales bacterium]
MEIDTSIETKEGRLNQLVGLTVLLFSVTMALGKIKDDNIVQAMQQYKVQSVDVWNEYQAKRLKRHLQQNSAEIIEALDSSERNVERLKKLREDVERYESESKTLAEQARQLDDNYDKASYRDDQFDLADAMLSISIALAGITALTRKPWMMAVSWIFGLGGATFTIAGFAGWALHPDKLIQFLT